MKKVIAGLVGFLLLITLAVVPAKMRSMDADQFSNGEREFVRHAIASTSGTLENPLERLLILGYRIDEMERVNGMPVEATVEAVTFFGVPGARVRVDRNGASVERRSYTPGR
ncbi:hypothetical protein [Salimicrobium flavidum]|uniref:Uncharacterized protein n=1 Tax=Salimicrobium flavidum TaxID=570947 RepID=A0A1N7J7B5_9BACI|nr:hypothetical protein [Salimicrobium flavidum]SIS45258.1 hypothetical protein SAMN05421687_10474 [Salimicrobium flavidum]